MVIFHGLSVKTQVSYSDAQEWPIFRDFVCHFDEYSLFESLKSQVLMNTLTPMFDTFNI